MRKSVALFSLILIPPILFGFPVRTIAASPPNPEFHPGTEIVPTRLLEHPLGPAPVRLPPTVCPDSFDMLHYRIDLDVDHSAQTIAGDGFLTFQALREGLGGVRFDLEGLSVTAVLRESTPLTFAYDGHTLNVDLDAPLAYGDTAVVEVIYGGSPGTDSVGMGGFYFNAIPPSDFNWGQCFYPDAPNGGRYWFPGVDQPCDKATFELAATTSLNKMAISNGTLDTVIVDSTAGTKEWHWRTAYPTPTCYMAVSIAKYREIADTTDSRIVHYGHRTVADQVAGSFRHVPLMMEYLEELYGPYPFEGEKFSFVTAPHGGAIEHETAVFIDMNIITGDSTYDNIKVHEIAHQWFGTSVTYVDWRDLWLSEGFATYTEALWYAHRWGPWMGEDFVYQWYVQDELYDYYFYDPDNRNYTIYDCDLLWGSVTYEKAGAVLHMLRHVVGDSLFFECLRTYYSDFKHGTATTTDFTGLCETVYGGDLDWFFDQWLYQPGHPVIDWGWAAEEISPGSWRVDVETRQVQTVGPIYTMPVDIRIQTAAGDTTVTAWIMTPTDGFSFVVDSTPVAVLFDPDNWLLDEASEVATGTPAALPPGRMLLGANRPNPFNPTTTIPFALPSEGPVTLRIYSVNGSLVRTLFSGRLPAGKHERTWDGADDRAMDSPSGVYFVRLEGAKGKETRKIQLVR